MSYIVKVLYSATGSWLSYVYKMLELELVPDCEKIVILGQHRRAVCWWAMQKGGDTNIIVNAFAFCIPRTARTHAVAHVGLSPESLTAIVNSTSTSTSQTFNQGL